MSLKERPAKRTKLFDGASSDESDDEQQHGVKLTAQDQKPQSNGFSVNEEYAKRFEHNKKREERQRLEEKFSKDGARAGDKRGWGQDGSDEDDEDDSEDESEDDDAGLATEDVDAEIMSTLHAIKSKDPRVYDSNVKFYRDFEAEVDGKEDSAKKGKEKPMYLQDYHRRNLLSGRVGGDDDEEDAPPQTYQQEQDQLKRELVGSMHAAGGRANDVDGDSSDEDEDFMTAKAKPKHDVMPAAKTKKITDDDIATAEKDPENYLSNFMAARAWLPSENSRWQAFDSDDSDEDKRADEFEEAYNMRFEDPAKANEKLQSFARDTAKFSVRRDEKTSRQKARDREREQKEAAKMEREEERARLRKLKIEEAEDKVNKIREAAGLKGKDVDLQQWRDVIEGDFDDEKWEIEMKRRFGEDYYAAEERIEGSDEEMADPGSKRHKVKKPKWNDDIDIGDLVPDFEEENTKPAVYLTHDDAEDGGAPLPAEGEEDDEEEGESRKKPKTKKDRTKEKVEAQRAARKQRRQIEEMIDSSLPLAHPSLAPSAGSSKAPITGFRYRETSPTSFGLSARDILFADDSQLNEYAGLKKMAAFRDPEKKSRDKKKFSKKQRLRQWRKDTFGAPDEPTGGFERILGNEEMSGPGAESASTGNVKEGERKKRKRPKKGKERSA